MNRIVACYGPNRSNSYIDNKLLEYLEMIQRYAPMQHDENHLSFPIYTRFHFTAQYLNSHKN
jgi:hypothetical protein